MDTAKLIPIPSRSEVAPVALEFHKEKLIQARKENNEEAISFHLKAIHRLECEISNLKMNKIERVAAILLTSNKQYH